MSSKTDQDSPTSSRRRFLKAGLGGAATLAAAGVATAAVANELSDSAKQTESSQEETKWVGAGYLMARPVKSNEVI
jgi:hypothetical protein